MNTGKSKSYEAGFKLKVVDYAEEHGNRGAEREFGVSEKVVRGWRKQKDQLKTMPKSKRAGRYGVTPYKDIENELSEWVLDLRSNGLIVTRLARAFQITDSTIFRTLRHQLVGVIGSWTGAG